MQLPTWHNTYLVLTAEDIPENTGEDILGIVHVPGMSCRACGMHLDTAFIQHSISGLQLVGKECTWSADAQAWYAVMKRARYYVAYAHYQAEQMLGLNQRTVFRALALLCQLHPWMEEYACWLQETIQTGKLSNRTQTRIQAMTVQLGGLGTLRKHRDQLRRLYLLDKVCQDHFLPPAEVQIITSLLTQGRNQILTDKQNHLIHALMDKHAHEREVLADQLLFGWDQQRKKLYL